MFQRSLHRLHVVLKHTSVSKVHMSDIGSHNDVIRQTVNKLGMIILNRPTALNSLNFSMMRKMYPQLLAWEKDNNVAMVMLKGAGDKAFCAGGDIKCLTTDENAKNFFKEEYPLDYKLGTYPKPCIAVLDGITMGGGVGISVHGPYRVATERTTFAMPETAIGAIPDVGTSYVLPRLQGKLGIYLGLTGFRLKGQDVKSAGIATHYINSNQVSTLEERLVDLDKPSVDSVNQVLQQLENECEEEGKEFILKPQMDDINRLFSGSTMEQIFSDLEKDGSQWSLKQLNTMKKMSPTSLKLTHRLLTEAADLGLKECFKVENRIFQRCLDSHDFKEGVRAVLVDKDQNPKWNPATLEEVTSEMVDAYFAKLTPEQELSI